MSEDAIFQASVTKMLKHMGLFPYKKFTVKDLESDLGMDNQTVRAVRDYLLRHGYIQEFFSTNLIDPNGKSEISYRITPKGKQRFDQIIRYEVQAKEQARRSSEYQAEKERIRKSNRRWLIICSIIFIVAIITVIIIGVSF